MPVQRTEAASRREPNRGAAELRRYLADHAKDVSKKDLAERFDCKRNHVSMLLTGTQPSLQLAARIERAIGIQCIAWTEPAVQLPPSPKKKPAKRSTAAA